MVCTTHLWQFESNQHKPYWFCVACGAYSESQPAGVPDHPVEEETEEETEEEIEEEEDGEATLKCRHAWVCLRDRCHNRGKGKYQAYKCELCGKFQRR